MIISILEDGVLIAISNVSKDFLNQGRVLDDVSLKLEKGDFIYLVGGSGAGKSTLLRMIATEDRPTHGSVSLFGYDLSQVSPSTLRSIRRSIGYIPQNFSLISDMSVFDNVMLSLRFGGNRHRLQHPGSRVMDLLEMMGLSSKRNTAAGELSGGERQRVAVARALVREPDIIIADEATGSQDRGYTWALLNLMIKANEKGSTVIFATHDQELVRRIKKRCATLKDGRMRFEDGICFY